jgi:hypothetical protein
VRWRIEVKMWQTQSNTNADTLRSRCVPATVSVVATGGANAPARAADGVRDALRERGEIDLDVTLGDAHVLDDPPNGPPPPARSGLHAVAALWVKRVAPGP